MKKSKPVNAFFVDMWTRGSSRAIRLIRKYKSTKHVHHDSYFSPIGSRPQDSCSRIYLETELTQRQLERVLNSNKNIAPVRVFETSLREDQTRGETQSILCLDEPIIDGKEGFTVCSVDIKI